MQPTQVALYARVSSDQQSEAKTIESQVADLRTRIAATGVALPTELEFVDNGYSGATLLRPALERLRDVVALISSMSIARIGWHATMPIRSFCWKNSCERVWR